MDYKEILYEVDNRVATITLNRPETLQAASLMAAVQTAGAR